MYWYSLYCLLILLIPFDYSQRLTHKDTKSIEETLRSEGNMVQCENGLLFEFPISPIDQQLRKYGSDSSSSEESSESEDIIETVRTVTISFILLRKTS